MRTRRDAEQIGENHRKVHFSDHISFIPEVDWKEEGSQPVEPLMGFPTYKAAQILALASSFVATDRREPVDSNDLHLVNQLLTVRDSKKTTPGVFNTLLAPPSSPLPGQEEERQLVMRRKWANLAKEMSSKIPRLDVFDDNDETNPGLHGVNVASWVLDAFSVDSDRRRQEFEGTGWTQREEEKVLPGMVANPTGDDEETTYRPMRQGHRLNRAVNRRPEQRPLSSASQEEIHEWFVKSGITIGPAAESPEQRDRAERLVYTWKDCFAFSVRDIRVTDLITHNVDLLPNAIPHRMTQPPYSRAQRRFASLFYPELERAGWIWPAVGEWAAYSLFPRKGDSFRAVHDYRAINKFTLLPQWPTHNKMHVFEDVLQAGHGVFMQADAAHGYHGVLITPGHESKAAVITPHAQYFTNRLPQGMSGSMQTYCALGDVVFGPWPAIDGFQGPDLPNLIGHLPHLGVAFNKFVDDHTASASSFDAMFDFLHLQYFPRIEFGRISLKPSKTALFETQITALGFEMAAGRIRPMHKHRDRFEKWAKPENHPTKRQELETVLYLLPYLKEFVAGRVSLQNVLKTSFMEKVYKTTPTGQKSKQMQWVDKGSFEWRPEHAEAFVEICEKVQNAVNTAPSDLLPFHLAVDTSDIATGAVLFQLEGLPPDTVMVDRLFRNLRVVAFMSFKLTDAETRYTVGERETLGVVKALTEAKKYLLPSDFETFLYTDHQNMLSTLSVEGRPSSRIAFWLDTLGGFRIKLVHRPNTDRVIQIADGFSRLKGAVVDDKVFDFDAATLVIPSALGRVEMERGDVPSDLYPFAVSRSLTYPGLATDIAYATEAPYQDIFRFIVGGEEMIEDLPEMVRRKIRREAYQYKIRDGVLMHLESPDLWAVCVIDKEVPKALQYAHNIHGHFSVASTMHQLKGSMWWPNRYQDVVKFVKGCLICQSQGTHAPLKVGPVPVVSLRPWDLVGTDYSGKITPAGRDGQRVIHIVVDYFSDFGLAAACVKATAEQTIKNWGPITKILGYPEEVYLDNASYFRDERVRTHFARYGTRTMYGPVYSPWSMGKAENMVKLIKRGLRIWAKKRNFEKLDEWPDAVQEIMFDFNNRFPKAASYSPG